MASWPRRKLVGHAPHQFPTTLFPKRRATGECSSCCKILPVRADDKAEVERETGAGGPGGVERTVFNVLVLDGSLSTYKFRKLDGSSVDFHRIEVVIWRLCGELRVTKDILSLVDDVVSLTDKTRCRTCSLERGCGYIYIDVRRSLMKLIYYELAKDKRRQRKCGCPKDIQGK